MPKSKRKPRKDLTKQDLDILVPLDLDIIGGEDDPCFGKLNDPGNATCRLCGDFEYCAMVMANKNHFKRAKLHEEGSYKDIEEVGIINNNYLIIHKQLSIYKAKHKKKLIPISGFVKHMDNQIGMESGYVVRLMGEMANLGVLKIVGNNKFVKVLKTEWKPKNFTA